MRVTSRMALLTFSLVGLQCVHSVIQMRMVFGYKGQLLTMDSNRFTWGTEMTCKRILILTLSTVMIGTNFNLFRLHALPSSAWVDEI